MFARWEKWRRRGQTGGRALYAHLSRQARNTAFFIGYGVADTPDGRFAMIVLHMFLIMERLDTQTPGSGGPTDHEGEELRRQMMEAFIDDMDQALREMGVGDLGVPSRVKAAAAEMVSVVDRMTGAVRASAGTADLAKLLTEIVPPQSGASVAVDQLADYIFASRAILAQQRLMEISAGVANFAALNLTCAQRHERQVAR